MSEEYGEGSQIEQSLNRAYGKVIVHMDQHPEATATETSVGFVGDCQVFVKAYRFNKQLLADHPLTGGLIVNLTQL